MITTLVDSTPIQFSELTEKMFSKLNDRKWIERFRSCCVRSERIALLRSYNVQTQEEEHIIQFLVDKFDPPRSSISYEGLIRDELERLEKNGEIVKTPEIEKEWEEKLETARQKDSEEERKTVSLHLANIRKIFKDITEEQFYSSINKNETTLHKPNTTTQTQKPVVATDSQTPVVVNTTPSTFFQKNLPPGAQNLDSAVTTITGIGEASGERLNEAGVYTVRDFMNLTYDRATKILKTPLGAIPFKEYFQKEELPQIV